MAVQVGQRKSGPDRQAAAFLRDRRRRLGLSPEQLAQRVGLSGQTIRRCELGLVPYINTQALIARFFDLEPPDIWKKDRLDWRARSAA